ncbi:hypothetical protein [Oceanisphaera sp. KMM 10153]|uniref:hypothetical protein n=1 Tax=Oceanisphaera submarina TaxID=3390193 RepID=UPI0039761406
MRTLYLHGPLAERFGDSFELDVTTAAEAVHALSVQLPGFRDEITRGNWHIVRGSPESEDSVTEQELQLGLGNTTELHLLPAVAGAGGALDAFAGFTLTLVAFMVGGPGLAATVAGGQMVTNMTTPVAAADYANRERPDQRPSFLFDGPVNTSTQGLPVPIICGRVKSGSVVISAGMTAEQI